MDKGDGVVEFVIDQLEGEALQIEIRVGFEDFVEGRELLQHQDQGFVGGTIGNARTGDRRGGAGWGGSNPWGGRVVIPDGLGEIKEVQFSATMAPT